MKTLTIFVTIIMIFCVTPVHPVIFFNYFCNNLIPVCEEEPTVLTLDDPEETENLAYLQAKSANVFLQAHGKWNEFLVKIEMMDFSRQFEYIELNNILENTAIKIEEAANIFAKISNISRKYQVNPLSMENLINFDYKWFCAKHNLNPDVMSEVECYLNTGDILGIPNRFREKLVEIKIEVEYFRQSIEQQEPNIETMYNINNELLSMALFGQYTSMIFREVRLQ